MTGQQLWEAARDGDAANVSSLLSTQAAQSFINYYDAHGSTRPTRGRSTARPMRGRSTPLSTFRPLHYAAENEMAVTEKLLWSFLAARCNLDLQDENGFT